MKNRTLKKMLTAVIVMAVTLAGCKKEEVTPEDPNLEWGVLGSNCSQSVH